MFHPFRAGRAKPPAAQGELDAQSPSMSGVQSMTATAGPGAGQAVQPGLYQNTNQAAQTCEWWDHEMAANFQAVIADLGLSDEQASALESRLIDALCAAEEEDAAEQDAAYDLALGELEAHWGAQADAKFAMATDAAMALGLDEGSLLALLNAGDPLVLLPALAQMGQAMQEDGALPKQGDHIPVGPASAQSELERLARDKEHLDAFTNRDHPAHAAAKAKRQALINRTLVR